MTAKRRLAAVVESPAYAEFASRIVKAMGRRACDDIDALTYLSQLAAQAEFELHVAVTKAREDYGYSWQDIGDRLNISRQAAQQRFGR